MSRYVHVCKEVEDLLRQQSAGSFLLGVNGDDEGCKNNGVSASVGVGSEVSCWDCGCRDPEGRYVVGAPTGADLKAVRVSSGLSTVYGEGGGSRGFVLLRFRRAKNKTQPRTRIIPNKPPMTPPAIVPVLDL